jgi:hypothetical protein
MYNKNIAWVGSDVCRQIMALKIRKFPEKYCVLGVYLF